MCVCVRRARLGPCPSLKPKCLSSLLSSLSSQVGHDAGFGRSRAQDASNVLTDRGLLFSVESCATKTTEMLPNDVVSNVPDITSTDLTKQDMGLCELVTADTNHLADRKNRIACRWLSE